MKYLSTHILDLQDRRSREGAWIEIKVSRHQKGRDPVAPARERGLKSVSARTGTDNTVAPARERGLKLHSDVTNNFILYVAPARERGLKLRYRSGKRKHCLSLPRGSVD